MLLIIILAALALLDVAAVKYGADSRETRDWRSDPELNARQFVIR